MHHNSYELDNGKSQIGQYYYYQGTLARNYNGYVITPEDDTEDIYSDDFFRGFAIRSAKDDFTAWEAFKAETLADALKQAKQHYEEVMLADRDIDVVQDFDDAIKEAEKQDIGWYAV